MKKRTFLAFFVVTLTISCSGRFVKKDEIQYLEKKYSGVYSVVQPVEYSYSRRLETGTQVRLYFRAGAESIKVYAYPATALREEALGKNFLHLFKEDFQNEKYKREEFENKLLTFVRLL